MPHVSIKLYPGRSEEEKSRLADQIVKDVMTYANCAEASVSLTIEEVPRADWPEKVYRPEILEKAEQLYKKPGYNPFE
ncbi:MAG TPA: tautomerase family protein [Bryobacteraceae bacterium]|jgi:4-oxalocrotonate tautomerase|nr:tautomerase family protein [Bryobacteraceae bacterium]